MPEADQSYYITRGKKNKDEIVFCRDKQSECVVKVFNQPFTDSDDACRTPPGCD